MDQPTATELFGETFEGLEVHSYPIKGGTAYWVTQVIDNTRRIYNQHTYRIIWDDGEEFDPIDIEDDELELWTKYLA